MTTDTKPAPTIASITISVNWSVEEWGLDCTRCCWGHTIEASRPSLAAIVQIAQDHIDDAHPADQHPATHDYLSTACLHEAQARADGDQERAAELHAHCSAMVGYAGVKRPAQCKWCEAVCRCDGHAGEEGS